MRGLVAVTWTGLWALAGCSSAPPIASQDPVAALDATELLLQQKEYEKALQLVDAVDPDDLTGRDLERQELLMATCLFETGSGWKGFKAIRKFAEEHRFSDYLPQVEELQYRIGKQLMKSTTGYWIFGSDKEDGEVVLTEFVQRFSANLHVPEALKMLGDLAFEEKRYFIARERYKQILKEFPHSEWAALARFKIPIAQFHGLIGPQYNLEEMQLTRRELQDYLDTNPERPEFREEAQKAQQTVIDWIAQRHVIIANFYRTIENRDGEVLHLQIAAGDFPATKWGERALARLRKLDPSEYPTPPVQPGRGSDTGETR